MKLTALLILTLLNMVGAELKPAPKGWQSEVKTLHYEASIDKTLQPALIYTPESKKKRPLLVALHTWSFGYDKAGGEAVYSRWCIENSWHFIHPHFRGPNNTPKAMGSEFAVQDILDAVEYMKKNYQVDSSRIYLIGVSGGGYASLLMAGRAPQIWAGVSSWCPITNIESWWKFHSFKDGKFNPGKYAKHIMSAVGGRPDQDSKAASECIKRSAVTYLPKAVGINLDINHGVHDGRKGSVPFTHSLYAFNKVAAEKDRFSESEIKSWYESMKLPASLTGAAADPFYLTKKPVFRRVSGNSRVTIFKGGHEMVPLAALNWLANQRKGKKAVWNIKEYSKLKATEKESKSNK